MEKAVTVRTLLRMKADGEKIAMMTAYDYPTAALLSESGLHVLLVGDSLGMVVQGKDTTVPVTLDQMIYHTEMVARGAKGVMVVADLPFMTVHISTEDALRSAGRLMQEGRAHAVKLEGGQEIARTVHRLVEAGVPVMGHIGLTPQSVHALGGFSVQGKTLDAVKRLLADAEALQDAGAFAIVLEMVPGEVAEKISRRLRIPTIGIGAGSGCDGQVLVFHDFSGFTSGYIPKHNKRYANLAGIIQDAAKMYVKEVCEGAFPGQEHTPQLKPEERIALAKLLGGDDNDAAH